MGNLEGGYCKKFKDFQVGFTSAAQKHILCNNFCISFTHSAFPDCFMMSWHCAFYLLVPWIFREKKKSLLHAFTLCLEYHLVEFAPELSRMMDSNHWWCLSLRRNQKYEPDICCLSISHSLESCISVHMNKTDFFSGGKSVNVLTLSQDGGTYRLSGCWSSSCRCSSDLEGPLCDPPGWWWISPCSFIDVYLKVVLIMGSLPP